MKKPTGTTTAPADEALLHAAKTGEGLIKVTPEMLQQLAKAAGKVKQSADEIAALIVSSPEVAQHVRTLRESGHTWRSVALACHELYNGSHYPEWTPPSNQLFGMALCEQSASMLHENPSAPPWN